MLRALVSAVLFAFAADGVAGGFAFQVAEPKFTVTLPDLPQLEMGVHPMNATHPHLRFHGAAGPYAVSVFTPEASAGMGALECALASLRSLYERPGVPPREELYRARVDETTYLVMYAIPFGSGAQLHAHLFSAAGGTHCVEVHASRVSESEDDVGPWQAGMEKARIQPGP